MRGPPIPTSSSSSSDGSGSRQACQRRAAPRPRSGRPAALSDAAGVKARRAVVQCPYSVPTLPFACLHVEAHQDLDAAITCQTP